MKKRFAIFLTTLLTSWMGAWADGVHFTYDPGQYQLHTEVYAALVNSAGEQLQLNDGTYYVGAFVNNICRAEATLEIVPNLRTHVFRLRVGGTEEEIGKAAITFRVFKEQYSEATAAPVGSEYTIPSSVNVQFQGDASVGEASSPFNITFTPATYIALPEQVVVHRGTSVDMSEKIIVEPTGGLLPKLTWDWENSREFFTMDDNMLTALALTPDGAYLGVNGGGNLSAYTQIIIDAPATKVTWKEEYSGGVKVNVGDYETLTDILNTGYILTPEDATTTFTWTSSDQTIVAAMESDMGNAWKPMKVGNATMTGIANDDSGLRLALPVTVSQPIQGFYFGDDPQNPPVVMVQVGDNVSERLDALIKFVPETASNKSKVYEISTNTTSFVNENNTIIATKAWDWNNEELARSNQITVRAQDGSNATASIVVYVIDKQPTALEVVKPTIYLTMPEKQVDLEQGVYPEEADCTASLEGNLKLIPEGIDLHTLRYDLAPQNRDVIIMGGDEDEHGNMKYYVVGSGDCTVDVTVYALDNMKAYREDGYIMIPDIELKVSFKVTVQKGLGSFTFADVKMTRDNTYELTLKATPENAQFDASLIEVQIDPTIELPQGWKFVEAKADDNDKLKYTLTAQSVGNGTITIYYNKEEKGEGNIYVGQNLLMNDGWQWISLYTGSIDGINGMKTAFGDNLDEVRSQSEVLINDTKVGYFGDPITLGAMQTYKLKMKDLTQAGATAGTGSYELYDANNGYALRSITQEATGAEAGPISVDTRNGWNWIGNPYQYYQKINDIFGETQFEEGDYIKGKEKFTKYENGQWVGTLDYLTPGEGYIFKVNGATRSINFNREFSLSQNITAPAAGARQVSVSPEFWKFNHHDFADNMAMIAYVNAVTDPSRCTLWAFVDGECRGRGEAIGDRQFITVHGKQGEKVTFRVYDEVTHLLLDVYGSRTLEYTSGSYKAPVSLYAGTVSDINGVDAVRTTSSSVYDLQGRRADKASKGIFMVVDQKADGQRVVRKIMK